MIAGFDGKRAKPGRRIFQRALDMGLVSAGVARHIHGHRWPPAVPARALHPGRES